MFPGVSQAKILTRKQHSFVGNGADFIATFDPSRSYALKIFSVEHKIYLHGISAKRIKGAEDLIMVQTSEGFVVMINKDTPSFEWAVVM